MAVAHEGLASLAVDLHEVGDLLALTNYLVQLHNLVGGSQVTPSLPTVITELPLSGANRSIGIWL